MTEILKNSQNIRRRKNIGTGLMVFSEFQECNSYYVDKTSFIKDLMNDGKQTLLFTRPRRFGKTLTQSMLKEFLCLNFEERPDHDEKLHKLFEHLQVSSDPEFCKQHMGRYPVIFISFKGIDQPSFEGMRSELIRLVRTLYRSFAFLLERGKIGEFDLNSFREYAEFNNLKSRAEEDSLITGCLEFLCELLKKIYDQKVIVLIDEYDVPINRGHSCGFYDQILPLIRGMLYPVVKDDRGLIKKCVVTGCNRISKESIFTGMNNAVVYSMSNPKYADVFGFTKKEVEALLEYYSLEHKKETIKEWYDGYHFGEASIYNPWDVMSYCDAVLNDPKAQPENYWSNTSGNEIIKEFIDYADEDSLNKMQELLEWKTVKVKIDEQLVYPDLEKAHSSVQLFSVLYSSGYLTALSTDKAGYELKIPNKEILELFKELPTSFSSDPKTAFYLSARELPKLMAKGYPGPVESRMNALLSRYLSVRNTGYEIAYHSFFLGILSQALSEEGQLRSEAEAGDGYADISFIEGTTGIILEFKKAQAGEDEKDLAEQAIKQVQDKHYQRVFSGFPIKEVIVYGIACRGKKTVVDNISFSFNDDFKR